MQSRFLNSTLFYFIRIIFIWIVSILFFLFIRNFGVKPGATDIFLETLSVTEFLLVAIAIAVFSGILYGCIELFYNRPYFQRQPYYRIILSKLVLFFIGTKLVLVIGLTIANSFNPQILQEESIVDILRRDRYWVVFSYFIATAAFISFFHMVSQKFGPGVLWNMFIGRYRNPREEQRVFMFLDLQSSTTIAEKLGHLKFSRLLQNCFADLTPVILKHNVEIYQYVGDEAVLSWTLDKGISGNSCIHTYFDFMDVLQSKSKYYENEFGLQPFFKAGIHVGAVIVAEVGLIKREIAYHGDVLNTTARIQSRCNELKEGLLISDQLHHQLSLVHPLESKEKGEELLKGKEEKVMIHSIRKAG